MKRALGNPGDVAKKQGAPAHLAEERGERFAVRKASSQKTSKTSLISAGAKGLELQKVAEGLCDSWMCCSCPGSAANSASFDLPALRGPV